MERPMAKHGHLPTYSTLLNPLPKTIHDQETVNSRRDPFSYVLFWGAKLEML